MPRVARLVVPDVSLHVVQRAHSRAPCFLDEDDYVAYLVALGTYAARFSCTVHAYCLMTNHVHLLLTPSHSNACALLMKHVAQRHSKRMNAKTGRSGSLWEGRFHSGLVTTDDYALACYRYIELNPVRACMVQQPSQYQWSSHCANVLGGQDNIVRAHPAFLALGTDELHRMAAYRQLCSVQLPGEQLEEIRRATRGGQHMGGPHNRRGRPKRSDSTKIGDCHQLEMVTVTD